MPIALLFVSAVPALATDTAPQGGPTGALGYDCDDVSGACTCSMNDPEDCERMLDLNSCEVQEEAGIPWDPTSRGFGMPFWYFLDCDLNTGVCTCNRTLTGRDQSTSQRPDRFDQADENAPGSDDITAPNNRRNETVGARRGTAPVQEGAQGEQEGEEVVPTRRDHRN